MPFTAEELDQIKGIMDASAEKAVAPLREKQSSFEERIRGASAEDERKSETKRGDGIGVLVQALAATKGDTAKAAHFAEKRGYAGVAKALGTADNVAGGFLVPEEYSNDIIEFLRPRSIVRKLGATTLPMSGSSLRIPRLNTGSTASYIGENAPAPFTQQQLGEVVLTFKKLAAFVTISNDLLRQSSPAADTMVRDDLVSAMAQAEDGAFIRSDGGAASPKGIKYWAANTTTSAGSTLANQITDLTVLLGYLRNANVRMIRPGWMLSPRTELELMTITNANGFYMFRQEMLTGKLWGLPYGTTTQIPINIGGSNTEMYLVDFADVIIGESKNLILDTSTEAAFNDGNGMQSSFQQDQTVIRAISEHDLVMRHDASAAYLTSVAY